MQWLRRGSSLLKPRAGSPTDKGVVAAASPEVASPEQPAASLDARLYSDSSHDSTCASVTPVHAARWVGRRPCRCATATVQTLDPHVESAPARRASQLLQPAHLVQFWRPSPSVLGPCLRTASWLGRLALRTCPKWPPIPLLAAFSACGESHTTEGVRPRDTGSVDVTSAGHALPCRTTLRRHDAPSGLRCRRPGPCKHA